MAFGISKGAVKYILESDKDLPKEQQTIFFIRQKTMSDENEISSRYTLAYQVKGQRKQQGPSNTKLNSANIFEIVNCVNRIENYYVPLDAPEINDISPAAHFKKKSENPESGIKETDINGVTYLQVPIIEGDDVKYIAVCMSGRDRTEIAEVAEDHSRLREDEKKD